MKIRKNALAGIALAATATLGLAACGSGASTAPGTSAAADGTLSGEITVYNAQHESLTKEWIDAFTAETGVKVTMRQSSDTEMSNQIIQEGQASPADVFLTENSPAMAQVENAGLFADVDKATIDQQLVTSSLNAVLSEVQSVKAQLQAIAANPVSLVLSLVTVNGIITVLGPLLTVS